MGSIDEEATPRCIVRRAGTLPAMENPLLQARIERLRASVHDLAAAVDDNLRSVMLLMTTEDEVTEGIVLQEVTRFEHLVMERAMELLGLQGPVARDLRWAMGMIRVAKDYERIQDLTGALLKRVNILSGTLLEENVHAMVEACRAILTLHAIVLELWKASPGPVPRQRLDDAAAKTGQAIDAIDAHAAESLMKGLGSAAELRELVLATRHLRRIADQIALLPQELYASST